MKIYDFVIIGGGAAGIFAALIAKETYPEAKVVVYEKTRQLLSKVKISGGGRCNVTHSCFDPKVLCTNYPRGNKELISAFHRFQAKDMIGWLEEKGVVLKTEADGRMFPITDNSLTIIDCFLKQAQRLGVEIVLGHSISKIIKENNFLIYREEECLAKAHSVLIATGSHPQGHQLAKGLGHLITEICPSLFTFNIPDKELHELSGISAPNACVSLVGTNFSQKGPILITHFGLSGPAIIKLSAWGARYLAEKTYKAEIKINWISGYDEQEVKALLILKKKQSPLKNIFQDPLCECPKRLWGYLLKKSLISETKKWADISSKDLDALLSYLFKDFYTIEGKTTHKEEFVTCGGISLKEVDFRTFESKICPKLFFAGEVLDIDGVTGGFNFQNAWTSSFIAAHSALSSL